MATLVDIYTSHAVIGSLVALVTDTSVRAHGVETAAIFTRIRHAGTLVNIFSIRSESRSLWTKSVKSTSVDLRAPLTISAPGSRERTTTLSFVHHRQVRCVSAGQVHVAHILAVVHTGSFIRTGVKASVTFTSVTPLSVLTLTVAASSWFCATLVDVSTLICSNLDVAGGAGTQEGSHHVLTVILALVGGCGAFIHIFTMDLIMSHLVAHGTHTSEATL